LFALVVARRRCPSATSCSSTRWSARPATAVDLTPLLLVDGSTVTSDAAKLAKVSVKAEVVGPAKGPKITIMKYKNKTGYRKRQGHRQHLTQVKITAIDA
jgi:large subunit ribosomal protein L21